MKLNQKLSAIAIGVLSFTIIVSPALAKQWYFKVQNDADSAIKKLYVSENNKDWGYFDIRGGIAVGATEKLIWDEATNNQSCTQWIKAVFSDGSESEPTQIDFCQDLEEPIVFSE